MTEQDKPQPREDDRNEELDESPVPVAAMTADDMVLDLRTKIERMGAVNMMAIDQFDDLELARPAAFFRHPRS